MIKISKMEKGVRLWLGEQFVHIGMDRPSNMDKIVKFIVDDVEASADPVDYHSGDFGIAFRRFIERGEMHEK